MKKIICGIFLSFVLILNLLVATYAFEEPVPPSYGEFNTNEEINSYNAQVNEYNQAVDMYNQAVDEEYNNALISVDKQNEEINQHNEAELQRIEQQNQQNQASIATAEVQNQEIQNQNAQNELEVNEHNKAEDEKVAAVEAANVAEEARINAENEERTAVYNAEMEVYNADYAEYEVKLAKYNKDKNIEAQILALGRDDSVEAYNTRINNTYNIPANTSVTENASASAISVENTYTVEEGAAKSGRMIPVHIEHNFIGTDISYSVDFEIDANDTITMMGIAAIGKAITEGNCMFYYNTDSTHSMGYWANSDSYLAVNPTATNDNDWVNGDTHTVTYKNSTNEYQWNFEDVYMIYNYWWQPLRTYKIYDIPEEPEEPTKPTLELEEFVPVIYTPQYMVFTPLELVDPVLIEVLPADIWENVSEPVKRQYLQHLALLNLLPEQETEEPELEPAPLVDVVPPEEPVVITMPEPVPKAEPTIVVIDEPTPKANGGVWALFNLIVVIINIILGIMLILTWIYNNSKKDDDEKIKNKPILRIISIIVFIFTTIFFILTENMKLQMVFWDKWSLYMVILLLIQILLVLFSKHKKVENSEN